MTGGSGQASAVGLADAHVHLFKGGYQLGSSVPAHLDEAKAFDAMADEMGIKAALVVGFEGADFCQGNNEHILEAAKKYAWAAPVVSWSTW